VYCLTRIVAGLLAAVAAPAWVWAQEMEPKAYSASPAGANFLLVAYARSTGDVVFDPSLPLSDVSARVGSLALGVGHTFGLFGRLTLVSGALPYAWANVTGKVGGLANEAHRSGLADARFKFSMNLHGNPASSAAEFAKAPRRTIVGTSLAVAAPTGQYYDTKLINIGSSRWAFKPEVGVSVPIGRWDLDGYVGAWLFTPNHSFYPGGLKRTQDPLLAVQGHAAYTFRSRAWLAADATWYGGGASQVEGAAPSTALNNSRLGVTCSLPLGRRQSIKIGYSSGMAVRTGSDFKTFAVAWQKLWLSPTKR